MLPKKEFAELVGVSVNTVQNWESGGKIPKSKHPILQSLTAKPHIIYGGQHVTGGGDAVNGDKIVEKSKKKSRMNKLKKSRSLKRSNVTLTTSAKNLPT